MNPPASYPHSAERYAADVLRATEYISRNPMFTKYAVTIREESMRRDLTYTVEVFDRLTASLRGLRICGELGDQTGDTYTLVRVEGLVS